jgi:hypothetical protein
MNMERRNRFLASDAARDIHGAISLRPIVMEYSGGIMTTQQNTQHAVAALLSQAGSAHGVYEESELNGVYDQNWPDWYAAYLVEHSLGQLLGSSLSVEQLSALLKQYDQDYKRERPRLGWPQFYAERLIGQMH